METHTKSLDELFICANMNRIDEKTKKTDSFSNYNLHTAYEWEILLIIERIKNYKHLKIEEKNIA